METARHAGSRAGRHQLVLPATPGDGQPLCETAGWTEQWTGKHQWRRPSMLGDGRADRRWAGLTDWPTWRRTAWLIRRGADTRQDCWVGKAMGRQAPAEAAWHTGRQTGRQIEIAGQTRQWRDRNHQLLGRCLKPPSRQSGGHRSTLAGSPWQTVTCELW